MVTSFVPYDVGMNEKSPRSRDTRPANWAKTYRRLMRNVVELREQGVEITLPDQFEKAPYLRTGQPSLPK